MDKDSAKKLMFEHDFQREIIEDALKIVENYVKVNKLILVGGMAIDFAMRLKGDFLYGPDTLPDYDFITPNFHKDAYAIADILTAKYDRVSVIGAQHVSTMRVLINLYVVADVTYAPQNVYNKLPTLSYEGIRIIHPHSQMIDQHIALSLPYENAPRETISGKRWTNDIERYDLLNKYYALEGDKLPEIPMETIKIDYSTIDAECIGGYAALAFWINKAKELGYMVDPEANKIGEIELGRNELTLTLPKTSQITISSDDYSVLLDKLQKAKMIEKKAEIRYFNTIYCKIPRRLICEKYEIIDNKGRMIGCYQPNMTKRVYFSNLQEIMVYLLTKYIYYGDEYAKNCYVIARDLLFWACDKYTGLFLTSTEEAFENAKEKYFIFLPTPFTFGNYNWAESYILMRQKTINRIIPKYVLELHRPKEAHLKKGQNVMANLFKFTPEMSPLYQIDGLECKEFEPHQFPDAELPKKKTSELRKERKSLSGSKKEKKKETTKK
jgi:hypothetical protein